MRIKELHMANYRQYKDMLFSFPHIEGKKDLHILVAHNCVGKSNILNAICWCLYGKEPHLRDEDTAIFRPNSHEVNKLRQQGGNRIEVSVELKMCTDSNQDVCFIRKEVYNIPPSGEPIIIDSQPTILETLENGDTRTTTDPMEAVSLVKKYIPEEINEYIFFDGDRLEHFFKKEYLKNVRDGISDLTQATLLDRAMNGFTRYVKEELDPLLAKCSNQDVKDYQLQVKNQEVIVNGVKKTIEEIETQIQLCDEEDARLTAIIREHEQIGVSDARLKEVTAMIEDIEKREKAIETQMMDFVRDYYPLFKLFPYIKEYYKHITAGQPGTAVPLMVEPSELNKIIESGTCSVCGQPVVSDKAIKYVQDLIANNSSATSAVKNQDLSAIRINLQKLLKYREKKEEFLVEKKNLMLQREELEEEQHKLQAYINSVPNTEEIKEAVKERGQYRETKSLNLQKLGVEKANLQKQEDILTEKNNALQSALSKAADMQTVQNRINYCKDCIEVLRKTREEVLEECRQEMQQETYAVFDSLLWKVGVFTGFEIKKDYTVWLYDEYGNQTAGSASSAETNLLALSFTLSLQKVSHHDSLLFIDTPTGRVDPENRENFMKALMKIPNKQMVLLFTPSEYTDAMKTIIAGDYSTYNELRIENKNTVI